MDLHLSLDAREVLFHLNIMGYSHVTREQLKSFMTDLKKLIKYETNPAQTTTETATRTHEAPRANPQATLQQNIERLFKSHTETSKLKLREKHPASHCTKDSHKENDKETNHGVARNNKTSGEIANAGKERPNEAYNHPHHACKRQMTTQRATTKTTTAKESNKENIPKSTSAESRPDEAKSKMWIRPKSAQSTRRTQLSIKKRNDPVALYQEYQKDWERFKPNICESSRSELRWAIREKMLANH